MIGSEVLGYRIESKLGEGGMGAVYVGVHDDLGQRVAIKFLDVELARNPEIRERFFQEARIQIALQHPGIVRVLSADTKSPQPALIMELVDGLSLADVIRRRGPLPVDDAVAFASKILDAVGFAHNAGVVHRDLKPANVMVQADGSVKVMDFGIARVIGNTKLTRTGTTMGSADYMPPEQVLGKPVDARGDIYALGCVLFEMLTGKPPFGGLDVGTDSDFMVKQAHVQAAAPDLRGKRAEVPAPVAVAIAKALAKNPDERFASTAAFASALEVETVAQAPGTPHVVASSPSASPVQTVPYVYASDRKRSGSEVTSRAPMVVLVLLGLALCSVFVFLSRQGMRSTSPVVSAPSVAAAVIPLPPADKFRAGETRVDDKGLTWVWMPTGSFHLGCEPQDTACEADEKPGSSRDVAGFWMAQTETTVAAYKACVAASACPRPHTDGSCNANKKGRGNHPINCVDWGGAGDFCRWAGARLPTAVEWEYAAKSGASRVYPWGDAPPTSVKANFSWTEDGSKETSPAGTYALGDTQWGVKDMSGNVWEWTSSDYDLSNKEMRGGSWLNSGSSLRASYRYGLEPGWRYDNFGFRCAQ